MAGEIKMSSPRSGTTCPGPASRTTWLCWGQHTIVISTLQVLCTTYGSDARVLQNHQRLAQKRHRKKPKVPLAQKVVCYLESQTTRESCERSGNTQEATCWPGTLDSNNCPLSDRPLLALQLLWVPAVCGREQTGAGEGVCTKVDSQGVV